MRCAQLDPRELGVVEWVRSVTGEPSDGCQKAEKEPTDAGLFLDVLVRVQQDRHLEHGGFAGDTAQWSLPAKAVISGTEGEQVTLGQVSGREDHLGLDEQLVGSDVQQTVDLARRDLDFLAGRKLRHVLTGADQHLPGNALEGLDERRMDVWKRTLDPGPTRIDVYPHDISVMVRLGISDDLNPMVTDVDDGANTQHELPPGRDPNRATGSPTAEKWLRLDCQDVDGHPLAIPDEGVEFELGVVATGYTTAHLDDDADEIVAVDRPLPTDPIEEWPHP